MVKPHCLGPKKRLNMEILRWLSQIKWRHGKRCFSSASNCWTQIFFNTRSSIWLIVGTRWRDQSKENSLCNPGGGHYEFLRMPFSLPNAVPIFRRLISAVLEGLLPLKYLVYLDDIQVIQYLFSTKRRSQLLYRSVRRLGFGVCTFGSYLLVRLPGVTVWTTLFFPRPFHG